MAASDDPVELGKQVAAMVQRAGVPATAENFNRAMMAILAGQDTTDFEKGGDAGGTRGGARASRPRVLDRAVDKQTQDSATNGVRLNAGAQGDEANAPFWVKQGAMTEDMNILTGRPGATPGTHPPAVGVPDIPPAPGAPVVAPGVPAPPTIGAVPAPAAPGSAVPTTAMEAATAPQAPGDVPVQVGEGETGAEAPISQEVFDRVMGEQNAPPTAAPRVQTLPLNERPPMAVDNPPGSSETTTQGSEIQQRPRTLREYGALPRDELSALLEQDLPMVGMAAGGPRLNTGGAPLSQLFSRNPLPFSNQFGGQYHTQQAARAAWQAQMLARQLAKRKAAGTPGTP